MNENQTKELEIAWYEKRPLYDVFAQELMFLLDRDPLFPKRATYTTKYRLKASERLLEKCTILAAKGRAVTASNFEEEITDLVGVRIICLRSDDIDVIKKYLDDLREDDQLIFVEGPSEKKSFVLNPSVELAYAGQVDFQYSGYSSIHYLVRIGPKHPVQNPAVRNLVAEVQVRNIFEEAWGEIDHRYRYELTRTGTAVPESVDSGFRALAMYLAAAACHSEYLCRLVDEHGVSPPGTGSAIEHRRRVVPRAEQLADVSPDGPAHPRSEPADEQTERYISLTFMRGLIHEALEVIASNRTVEYTIRRANTHAHKNEFLLTRTYLTTLLNDAETQERFRFIYRDVLKKEPFVGPDTDPDVASFVNFALFRNAFPHEVAERNLEAALIRRSPDFGERE